MVGVLLLASLTLLPWHSGGPAPTTGGGSGRTAIQSPNATAGIGAAVLAAAAVAWLATSTLLARPRIPYSGRVLLALGGFAFGLVVLKMLLDPDRLAVGAWASLVLGAGFVTSRVTRVTRR